MLFGLYVSGNNDHLNFTVSGDVNNNKENGIVIVRKPIEGFFNNTSYEASDTCKMLFGKFEINIKCKTPVFIFLDIVGEYVSMIATPGGKVHIRLEYSNRVSGASPVCEFRGSNAAGHRLFFNYNYVPVTKFEPIWKILKSADEIFLIEEVRKEIKKQLLPFDELFQKREISEEYYELVCTTIKSLLLFETVRRLGDTNISNLKIKNPDKRISTVRKLFNLHSPINKNLYYGHQSYLYSQYYFTFNRAVRYGKYIYDQPDTIINFGEKAYRLTNDFAAIAEIRDTHLKEFLFATSLKSVLMVHLEEILKDEIAYFFAVFPESKFTKSILNTKNAAMERIKQERASHVKSYKAVLPEIIDTTNKFRDFSFNKEVFFADRLLYIDIWATWCGPCLQEMQYNFRVDSFLDANNMKRVYISIDNLSQKARWESLISQIHLGGYHILAGNELSKVISGTIGYSDGLVAIPHYMVIRNGIVLIKDAARPSDFENLKKQLTEVNKLPDNSNH